MKSIIGLNALALTLLVECTTMPSSAPKEVDEHAAHHPAGTSTAPAPPGYDQQMFIPHFSKEASGSPLNGHAGR